MPPLTTQGIASNIPLQGYSLIEASAGTGKTFTITEIYLRLLLETDLLVDQILVLTYTNAATAELRERLRHRLVLAHEELSQDGDDERLGQRKLTLALESFDEASIYTIHGFCQRVLTDEAFAAQEVFDFTLAPDRTAYLAQIVRDFWRRQIEPASALFGDYVRITRKASPETLITWLEKHVGKPFSRVEGRQTSPIAEIEAEFRACYIMCRDRWRSQGGEVRALLCSSEVLNRSQYQSVKVMRQARALDTAFSSELAHLWGFNELYRFSSKCIQKATKKDKTPPDHPFFLATDALVSSAQRLNEVYALRWARLCRCLLEEAPGALERRARRQGVKFYDDLLNHLLRALRAEGGEDLIRRLQLSYRAVLVDEFQDIDPVQWNIIERIYADTSCPVIYVGDPKQAIYGFRGADVFTYLHAKKRCDRVLGLEANYRSTRLLINGLNALFQNQDQPFLLSEIDFSPVRVAERARGMIPRREMDEQSEGGTSESLNVSSSNPPLPDLNRDAELLLDGFRPEPIQFLCLNSPELSRKKISEIRQIIAQHCAHEINALLRAGAMGRASLAGRELAQGDIAVLVRTHHQARVMQEALQGVGVAAVYRSQRDVFQTREAHQLAILLGACVQPGNTTWVRAALVSDFIGYDATQLYDLEHPSNESEEVFGIFHEMRWRWRVHGFGQAFRWLMDRFSMAKVLLAQSNGEQRLGNLLHLSEYLCEVTLNEGLGCAATLGWFHQRIRIPNPHDEAATVRPETDEQRVEIVTIHGAKGLEYPIVFCPFTCQGGSPPPITDDVIFHERSDGYQAVLHLGPDIPLKAYEALVQEWRAEDMRLLYVALTRAQYRLYITVGAMKDYASSALAWLLHREAKESIDGFEKRFDPLAKEVIEGDIRTLCTRVKGSFGMHDVGDSLIERVPASILSSQSFIEVSARRLDRRLRTEAVVTSYSGVILNSHQETPDHDASAQSQGGNDQFTFLDAPEIRDDHPPGLNEIQQTFPRGAKAGSCLHRVLEEVDFYSADGMQAKAAVEAILSNHGIDSAWADSILHWLGNVLRTPLLEGSPLTLQGLHRGARRCEIEFYYPVKPVSGAQLVDLLTDFGFMREPSGKDRVFGPEIMTRGYLKGYIDLVFEASGRYYVIDYKSNWLGVRTESYAPASLAEVMRREFYDLQALIYAVALHRFLRWRLRHYDPDRHFGGIAYLFLRGMSQDDGARRGIYWCHPSGRALHRAEGFLCGG